MLASEFLSATHEKLKYRLSVRHGYIRITAEKALAVRIGKMLVGNPISKKEVLIWAPVLATEPLNMVLNWLHAVKKAGFDNTVLIFNGPGSEKACTELRREILSSNKMLTTCLSGSPSIGSCQAFVTHLFLQSKARFLVRVDVDLQFPIKCVEKLLRPFEIQEIVSPDIVFGQRDEASAGGHVRFLGNVVLRLFALLFDVFADPNCGIYVLSRRAAALLCSVPLPTFPEPRMLVALQQASLRMMTCVVPTLPRHAGRSSIKGLWRSFRVFTGSLLELLSWDVV
jgi:hypothetical protein